MLKSGKSESLYMELCVCANFLLQTTMTVFICILVVVTVGFAEVVYTVSESDVYFNVSIVKDGPTASSISILLSGDAAG